MITRRHALGAAVGAAATTFLPRAALAGDATLAEVIARHTAAMGGAARLDARRSKYVALTITEKGDSFAGRYRCNADPAWRIDIYVGGEHVFAEGLDAQGPWIWPSSAPAAKDAVPDAKRTGLQGIEFHLYGLHRFAERGHTVALDAPQTIEGVRYHVVRVNMADAYETFLFINPRTWLIDRRRDERAPHPDIDPNKTFIEKQASDYRSVDGIMVPFVERQVDLVKGTTINVSTLETVAFNQPYPEGTFTRGFKPG